MKRFGLLAIAGGLLSATAAFAAEHGGGRNPRTEWNELWHHVYLDIVGIGIIFSIISLWFLFGFRRQRPDQEGDMPVMGLGGSLSWALIPAFLFLADDFYLAANGWKVWNTQRQVPEDAYEIKVTAMKWAWDFEYENGASISTSTLPDRAAMADDPALVVPMGKPVVFRMVSDDVIHGFFLPHYRIKEDVMPGRITYEWILPDSAEETIFTCTEYCGDGHSRMFGRVTPVSEDEFNQWLEENA